METGNIEQPNEKIQKALDMVLEDTPEDYIFRGKRHKMRWLGNMTVRKMTHVMLTEKNEHRRNVKLCAILRLNGIFAWFRPLVYAVKWRWYAYVLDLSDTEALRVVNAAKKKVPSAASLLITILATAMTDTQMAMTRKEASATQAGQAGEPPTR